MTPSNYPIALRDSGSCSRLDGRISDFIARVWLVPVSDSETLYHTLVRVLHPLLGTEFDANVSYFVGFSGFYLADCSLPLDLSRRNLVLWVRVHSAIHGDCLSCGGRSRRIVYLLDR